MKNKHYLLLTVITLFLFSCTIEKRLYRPGFYVSGHLNEKTKFQNETNEEPIQQEATVNSDPKPGVNTGQIEFCQTIKHETDPVNSNKQHLIKPSFKSHLTLRKTPLVNSKRTDLVKKKNSSRYNDYEDVLIITGFLVAILGLVLMIVGYVLLATNPPFAQALLIVGLALFILGIITAGIGDPSIFIDIILAILEAL